MVLLLLLASTAHTGKKTTKFVIKPNWSFFKQLHSQVQGGVLICRKKLVSPRRQSLVALVGGTSHCNCYEGSNHPLSE
jgi:hypothetical protein